MSGLVPLSSVVLGLVRVPGLIARVIATEAFLLTTNLRLGRRRSLWSRGARSY